MKHMPRVGFYNNNIGLNTRRIDELATNYSETTTNPRPNNPIMCPQALEIAHWQNILAKTHRKPQEQETGCDHLLMLVLFLG